MPTPNEAAELIRRLTPAAIARLNTLAQEALQTRGGRAGSGLGSLLEALWGFMVNTELKGEAPTIPIDLAWFPDHAYNDFACIISTEPWDPKTKTGELLRVEAKSMFWRADESKAHFDALERELGEHDILVVLIWDWVATTSTSAHPRVSSQVTSFFVGSALEVARFRDALHEARGGGFVAAPCPDGCTGGCTHEGEPLNADGRRERRTGPESRKPRTASYAANFGGLVRMLKTNSAQARAEFRRWRLGSDTVHRFVSFIHEAFPSEETSQYLLADWRSCAERMGISDWRNLSRDDLVQRVRAQPDYRESLRQLP